VSLVVDASVALSWCFQDERTEAIVAILRRVAVAGAIVPALWRLEVLSGLQVAVRRGRIDNAYRNASLADLLSLAITIDPDTNRQAWSATVRLCDRFGLTP
jgi:predicted nucleic acid-binding protein